MPFKIIRDDITRVKADAIVNTANPLPRIGAGTDSAIYAAAGIDKLLAARKKIGPIHAGKAAVTPAFDLDARYIIHTVGPVWIDGEHGEEKVLRSCYDECLKLAESLSCESIAFPLIASGTYGFPKDLAIKTATSVIYDHLMKNDMEVYLVVFDRKAYALSSRLFEDVRAYIDENYVDEQKRKSYGFSSIFHDMERARADRMRRLQDAGLSDARGNAQRAADQAPPVTIEEMFQKRDMTFQEYLLKLIMERDLKNSDVYHGANISKQHFSKIMSNKDYHPTKNTVCALAISLRLDLPTTEALLAKAGLALSGSSRFDLAVEYFITNRMYNIVSDNIILDENDLDLLGTQ